MCNTMGICSDFYPLNFEGTINCPLLVVVIYIQKLIA